MDLTVQISIDPAILVGLIYTVRLFLIHEQGILVFWRTGPTKRADPLLA